MTPAEKLARQLRRLYPRRKVLAVLNAPTRADADFAKYKHDPVGFCEHVLGVILTPDQQRVMVGLAAGKRVKVNSGHSLGKSFVAACAIIWWFYTRNPGVAVTTAPTRAHVETVLWTEVRLLILRAKVKLPEYLLPKAPKLYEHPDHWAEGLTAASREGFHGRHRPSMLFVLDECEGIDAVYWNAIDTMYIPHQDHAWLAIGNPYTTSTQSYLEDMATERTGGPKWDVISLSALNHPNVAAELAGRPPVVPNAVSVHQIDQWVHSRCTPVDPADRKPRDVEWPPARPCPTCQPGVSDVSEGESASVQADVESGQAGLSPVFLQPRGGRGASEEVRPDGVGPTGEVSADGCSECCGTGLVGGGKWYRPGPWFLAACMGIRPTTGIDTVWSEDAWVLCTAPRSNPEQNQRNCWLQKKGITIGIDASGYGCFDDETEILTDRGWLKFQDLWGSERVLTLRPDKVAEWGQITQVHEYEFHGDINLYERPEVNFCITDNHNLISKGPGQEEFTLRTFEDLPKEFVIPRTNTWEGEKVGPMMFTGQYPTPYGGYYIKTSRYDAIDWMKFLGWFISEGNTRKNGDVYESICIAQVASQEKIEMIRELLTKMRFKFKFTGTQFVFANREVCRHLVENTYVGGESGARNKRVPDYVKNATPEQINAFLTTFCMGDGTFRNGRRGSYVSTSKTLVDDLQEMLSKIGSVGKLKRKDVAGSEFFIGERRVVRKNDSYVLSERQKPYDCFILKKNVTRVRYDGYVYCVSTPYKTICVRRKGCAMWSGNSDDTVFHVRSGPISLHHEAHNGWEPGKSAGRLKELCCEYADVYNSWATFPNAPRLLPTDVDVVLEFDGGYGIALHSHRGEYTNWRGITVGGKSDKLNPIGGPMYYNLRSEIWCEAAALGAAGQIDLSRLPIEVLDRMRVQLLTPFYEIQGNGCRLVESKDEIKTRLRRSPDDADSFLVSHHRIPSWSPEVVTRE